MELIARKTDGLYVEEIIENVNDYAYLSCHRFLNDSISKEECERYFKDLVDNKILMANSFNDLIWRLYSDASDSYYTITFDLSISKDIILSIKKFIIVKLKILNYSSKSLVRIKNIIDMMHITHNLDIDYIFKFKQVLVQKDSHYYYECLSFLKFTNVKNSYQYYQEIVKLNIKDADCIRKIPSFETIIKYDYIIKDFCDCGELSLKMKYSPIIIWWFLSTIIPIRPKEMLVLQRDYLYEKSNKYFIHIERTKCKKGNKINETPIMEEFEIPHNVYKFISDYICYVNSIDDSIYLFSRKVFEKNFKNAHKLDNDRLYSREVRAYYKFFFKEVVENIYGFDVVEIGELTNSKQIEKVHMGDTRHIAFINMMMQGLNPLYIQRIGGHYSIDEQMHYCNHLDTFTTTKTYVVSKLLKSKDNMIGTTMQDDNTWAIKEIQKNKMGYDFYNLPIVQDGAGRCTSTNLPNDCKCEECLFCKHFIPEKEVFQNYLMEQRIRNEKNIEISKQVLTKLLSDMNKEYLEDDMQQTTSSLASLINQSMIINAYMLREENLIEK